MYIVIIKTIYCKFKACVCYFLSQIFIFCQMIISLSKTVSHLLLNIWKRKGFLDEIETFFIVFEELSFAIKNKNVIKNSRHKLYFMKWIELIKNKHNAECPLFFFANERVSPTYCINKIVEIYVWEYQEKSLKDYSA